MLNRNVTNTAMRRWLPSSVSLFTMLLVSACGGGSSSSPTSTNPSPVVNSQSLGGIWDTKYTVTTGLNTGDVITGIAIATENGDFFFGSVNDNNGCAEAGFGQASVSGSSFTGTLDWGLVQFTTIPGVATNCVEPDGSTNGTATITGTVAQRSSLTLTDTDTTSIGTVSPVLTTTWTYNALYSETPSLNTIAGNWTFGSDTVNISSSGAIFEQDPNTGCVVNGQVAIPNASYNAYTFSITYSSCAGSDSVFNGSTATGMLYVDDTVTPNQLIGGWSVTVSGKLYVIVADMPRQ
jgi:hypothetical protein